MHFYHLWLSQELLTYFHNIYSLILTSNLLQHALISIWGLMGRRGSSSLSIHSFCFLFDLIRMERIKVRQQKFKRGKEKMLSIAQESGDGQTLIQPEDDDDDDGMREISSGQVEDWLA